MIPFEEKLQASARRLADRDNRTMHVPHAPMRPRRAYWGWVATPAAALVGIVFGMSLHLFVAEEKGVRQICSTDTIRILQPIHDTLYLTQIVERERVIEKPVTQVAEADAGEADLQPEECTSIQCDGINYAILASN